MRATSKWEDKMRIALVGVLPSIVLGGAALAYVIYPSWMAWFTLPLPSWLRWAGVFLGVVAFIVRVWSQKVLGKEWSPYLHLREDHGLVMDGPYRWIRHPIYAVSFAFRTALILESANLVITLPNLAIMTFVYPRVRKEEAMMTERFGDQYRAYMARTGRFLPRLTTGQRKQEVTEG